MTTPLRVDWIDLSNWQKGTFDFHAAKQAGLKGVFHKATEGTGYKDGNYGLRRAQVHDAGLPFGAYHFARPAVSDGKTQARYFLSFAKPHRGDLRPMLDLEDNGGKSITALTAWVGDFVAECVAQTGAPPFIYTKFNLARHFNCPLWTARYSNTNGAPYVAHPWKTYTVWQFSNGVYGWPNSEPGVGHVDLNTLNGDPAKLTAIFTLGYEPPAQSQPVSQTTAQPAAAPPAPAKPAPTPLWRAIWQAANRIAHTAKNPGVIRDALAIRRIANRRKH